MRLLSILLIFLISCTVPDKASLRVMRDTKKLQKSPVILRATNHGNGTRDKLVLRQIILLPIQVTFGVHKSW